MTSSEVITGHYFRSYTCYMDICRMIFLFGLGLVAIFYQPLEKIAITGTNETVGDEGWYNGTNWNRGNWSNGSETGTNFVLEEGLECHWGNWSNYYSCRCFQENNLESNSSLENSSSLESGSSGSGTGPYQGVQYRIKFRYPLERCGENNITDWRNCSCQTLTTTTTTIFRETDSTSSLLEGERNGRGTNAVESSDSLLVFLVVGILFLSTGLISCILIKRKRDNSSNETIKEYGEVNMTDNPLAHIRTIKSKLEQATSLDREAKYKEAFGLYYESIMALNNHPDPKCRSNYRRYKQVYIKRAGEIVKTIPELQEKFNNLTENKQLTVSTGVVGRGGGLAAGRGRGGRGPGGRGGRGGRGRGRSPESVGQELTVSGLGDGGGRGRGRGRGRGANQSKSLIVENSLGLRHRNSPRALTGASQTTQQKEDSIIEPSVRSPKKEEQIKIKIAYTSSSASDSDGDGDCNREYQYSDAHNGVSSRKYTK